MTDKANEIAALLAPTVHALGLELLGVEYLAAPGGALLRLYIDLPTGDGSGQDDTVRGVTIEHCEAVSREVSAQLDVADPIVSHYTLEVSSPGVDRPLFTPAQFARFIGESAKVTLKLPQDGRRRLQGGIVRVDNDTIVFDVALRQAQDERMERVTIAFDNIEKARLVPDWGALGYGPAKALPAGDARPGKRKNNGRAARPDRKQPNKPAARQSPRAE